MSDGTFTQTESIATCVTIVLIVGMVIAGAVLTNMVSKGVFSCV